VWQTLRTELHPLGLEIVTVALDINPDDAYKFIDRAAPDHPSLIDSAHLVDELLGVVNVPNGVWIDENGTLVRPAEPSSPGRNKELDSLLSIDTSTLPPHLADTLREARKIKLDHESYVLALRDWVANGAASRYALAPDEVVRRSQPRPLDVATAAAAFELGQTLHRRGDADDAVRWFRKAHRLQPDNWTYKRQAWSLIDPLQGPTDTYDGHWAKDIKEIGAENYYPPLDL
jgi:tetratricopeptide (TPR) repeat protein